YGSHVAAAVLPFPGGFPEDKLFQRVYRAYECPGLLEPPENLQSLLLRQAFSFSCHQFKERKDATRLFPGGNRPQKVLSGVLSGLQTALSFGFNLGEPSFFNPLQSFRFGQFLRLLLLGIEVRGGGLELANNSGEHGRELFWLCLLPPPCPPYT